MPIEFSAGGPVEKGGSYKTVGGTAGSASAETVGAVGEFLGASPDPEHLEADPNRAGAADRSVPWAFAWTRSKGAEKSSMQNPSSEEAEKPADTHAGPIAGLTEKSPYESTR